MKMEENTLRQVQERSENPFIPFDPVAAPTLTKLIFDNELVGGDMQWGESEKRGRELIPERINYKHWSGSEATDGCTGLWFECVKGRESAGGRKRSWNKDIGMCQRGESLFGCGLVVPGSQVATEGRRKEVGIDGH